jgi:hypothetical protein
MAAGRIWALGLFVALLFTSAIAAAQPRVAVLDFTGSGAGRARAQAVRSISSGGATLVASSDVGSPSSADEYAAAAAEHGVRAFVRGAVSRRGRRWTAEITVLDSTGNTIAEQSYRGRNAGALGRALRDLWSDISGAVESAPEPPAPAGGGGGGGGEDGGGDGGGDGGSAGGGGGGGGADLGRVVVMHFDGPGSSRVRDRVKSALEDGGADVTDGPRDADATSASARISAARDASAAAVVTGVVAREGRSSYTARISVYDGSDGSLLDESTFESRSANDLLDTIGGDLVARLGEAVAEGTAPSGGGDGGGGDGGGGGGGGGMGKTPLTFAVTLGGFNRNYSYNDDIFGRLRAYSLDFGPLVGAQLLWFPAAHFTDGFAGNIGLDARFETAFGIKSRDSRMLEFPTNMWGWSAGARVRIPFDDHQLFVNAGYGQQSFSIDAIDVDNPKPEVPDVNYKFLRAGAGARLAFGPLAFEVDFAYLFLLSSGQLGSEQWFPREGGGGIEAGLTVGFFVVEDVLELRLGGQLRRYFFSLNPEVGDPDDRIAGGALDQYWLGNLGIAVHLPGN